MKTGKIYKLISPIDNEPFYVGKTIYSIQERLRSHVDKTKSKIANGKKLSKKEIYLKFLINLNQIQNVKVELIEECEIEKINEREIFWISEYRTKFKLKNLTDGGDGGLGYKHDSETIKKISENRKGKHAGQEHYNYGRKIGNEKWFKLSEISKSGKNPNIGKPKSEATKLKISKANSGENNGMFGKSFKRTEEQKEKLSKSLKSSDKLKESRKSKEYRDKLSDHFSIPILVLDMCFNIVFEFKNSKDCAEHLNYNPSNILNAIRFLRKIGKGRKEKYWVVRKEGYENYIEAIKSKIGINQTYSNI